MLSQQNSSSVTSQVTSPHQNGEEIIQTICQLAKKQDKDGLEKFFAEHYPCDLNASFNNRNAIILLAEEGDQQAVEFLCKYFNASLNLAAEAAARAGNEQWARALIKQGASSSCALLGAASHGKNSYFIDYLLGTGANILAGIKGAAREGHVALLETFLRFKLDFAKKKDSIDEHGSSAEEEFIIKAGEGYVVFSNLELLSEAVKNAAIGGHVELVNKLLAEDYLTLYAINPDSSFYEMQFVLLNPAIQGAREGGHRDLLKSLLEQGQGVFDNIVDDKKETSIVDKIYYAAQAGHVTDLHFLLSKIMTKQEKINSIFKAVQGALEGKHRQLALALMKDKVFLHHLSKERLEQCLRSAAYSGHVDVVNKLQKIVSKFMQSTQSTTSFLEYFMHTLTIHNSEQTVWNFLTGMDDEKIRNEMVQCGTWRASLLLPQCRVNPYFIRPSLSAWLSREKVSAMYHMRKEYDFDLVQLKVWPELYAWYEAGIQLMNQQKNLLSVDTFVHISAILSGLSDADARTLLSDHNSKMSDKLLAVYENKIPKQFRMSKAEVSKSKDVFFKMLGKQRCDELQAAQERYKARKRVF